MAMTQEELGLQIKKFVEENFIFTGQSIDIETSLIGSGTIDSTGIIEVIGFLEETFNVQLEDDELVAKNFDSIAKIREFMFQKLGGAAA